MGRESLDVVHARNVGATGLSVHVPHGFVGFDLAVEVELIVTLPRSQPFLSRGVIKYVRLYFIRIKNSHRDAVERYVHSRTS
ncbi:MAG: hypothetical protein GY910_04135 [bacterium]|nr:hypothetical protein [Deltaproteobacteria bacterium]MCP4904149.1 hypothetical protein [bacterium]